MTLGENTANREVQREDDVLQKYSLSSVTSRSTDGSVVGSVFSASEYGFVRYC